MQNRMAFEVLDRTCCDIRDDERPFAGITVVFGGDFQQILPVVVKGSQEDIVSVCLKHLYLWPLVIPLKLTRNMCLEQGTEGESEFATWLLDIGRGHHLSPEDNHIYLHEDM
jgi:hypothetical protein